MAGSKRTYQILYDEEVFSHLAAIARKYHAGIREAIEQRLSRDPLVEDRNRKPLTRPAAFEEAWELRCGHRNEFRVFYQVDPEPHIVHVLAVGVKVRNRLLIGGEEFEL